MKAFHLHRWQIVAARFALIGVISLSAVALTTGPLGVHPDNPRHFATPEVRAFWLIGSHI